MQLGIYGIFIKNFFFFLTILWKHFVKNILNMPDNYICKIQSSTSPQPSSKVPSPSEPLHPTCARSIPGQSNYYFRCRFHYSEGGFQRKPIWGLLRHKQWGPVCPMSLPADQENYWRNHKRDAMGRQSVHVWHRMRLPWVSMRYTSCLRSPKLRHPIYLA